MLCWPGHPADRCSQHPDKRLAAVLARCDSNVAHGVAANDAREPRQVFWLGTLLEHRVGVEFDLQTIALVAPLLDRFRHLAKIAIMLLRELHDDIRDVERLSFDVDCLAEGCHAATAVRESLT